MNYTFRPYPSHPWIPGWSFETRNCGISFREMRSGYFFQAGEDVGNLEPQIDNPEWSLQIPLPQNCHTNILFNGFCGYLKHKKKEYAAEAFLPEPGVLRGQFNDIPAPQLLSEIEVVAGEHYVWINAEKVPALLMVAGNNFCLITKKRIKEEAIELAQKWMATDLEELISREFACRSGAIEMFEKLIKHDSLTVLSAECLMRSIRPPEDRLAFHWSKSSSASTPSFYINEIYSLVVAWKHLDPAMARELVLSALRLQAPSGAIPVCYSPHQTFSTLEAPKPLLCKAAEQAWESSPSEEFLDEVIPALRRHLQWSLHHFDPKRRGWHYWQNRKECLMPQIYSSEIATVDLTVLLLTEIDSLNRMRAASPNYRKQAEFFKDERETLASNLLAQFWNEDKGQFCNAYHRGKLEEVDGVIAFLPTLWRELPSQRRSTILDEFKKSGSLPGGYNILSWRKSVIDRDDSFPILHQVLALEALKVSNPGGTLLIEFSRIMLDTFVEWHSDRLAQGIVGIDVVTAAYILNLAQTHGVRAKKRGPIFNKLYKIKQKTKSDRNDLLIIGATLIIATCFHFHYKTIKQPPELAILVGQLELAYKTQNPQKIITLSQKIFYFYPDQSAEALLYCANVLIANKDPAKAEELLIRLRKEKPDCPAAMISLGLTQQQQGKFLEAEKNYSEFIYLFDEIFPELTERIKQWRYLLREKFKNPPNWHSIYDTYDAMHELGD